MKKIIFQISMFLLFFVVLVSCNDNNSPSAELKNGGSLKVTASTGTIKIMNNSKAGEIGYFYSIVKEPNSTDKYYDVYVGGITDVGMPYIEFMSLSPIQTGKEYSDTYKESDPTIHFEDWISADSENAAKTTIQFSNYQYPGRITGIAVSYDKNGKILAKGEFDFISIKSSI